MVAKVQKYPFSVLNPFVLNAPLTLSWRRPLSYRNQSNDLQSKLMDWFLYDNGLRHERINSYFATVRSLQKIQVWKWKHSSSLNQNFVRQCSNLSSSLNFLYSFQAHLLLLYPLTSENLSLILKATENLLSKKINKKMVKRKTTPLIRLWMTQNLRQSFDY